MIVDFHSLIVSAQSQVAHGRSSRATPDSVPLRYLCLLLREYSPNDTLLVAFVSYLPPVLFSSFPLFLSLSLAFRWRYTVVQVLISVLLSPRSTVYTDSPFYVTLGFVVSRCAVAIVIFPLHPHLLCIVYV